MAKIEVNGIDEMVLSMEQIADLSGSGVLDEMLEAEAAVVIKEQQSKARSMGVYDAESTVHIADSITSTKPKDSEDGRKCYVYPQGSRTRNGIRTTNSEIAFINEYGKTGQTARPFIRTANAAAEAKAVKAAEDVYDDYLKSKDLI